MTGPAYNLANEAYAAYGRGDYATALSRVREAIRQRPDVARIQGLLVDILEASGQLQEAEKEARGFVEANPQSAEMSGRLNRLRNRLAQKPAEAAYRALEKGDIDGAAQEAGKAVELSPDVAAYHLLLIDVLLKKKEYKQASDAANKALELDSEDANALVMRAYAHQRMGDIASANEDFDQALAQDWLSEGNLQSIRLIAVDAAIASGDTSRARTLLQNMDSKVAGVQQRLQRVSSNGDTASNASDAFTPPLVECRVTPYGQVCSLLPGYASVPVSGAPSTATNDAYEAANAAYKAFSARNYALAETKARQAIKLAPDNTSYKSLLINVLSARKLAQAPRSQSATPAMIDPAYAAAVRIGKLFDTNQTSEARVAYDTALGSGLLKSMEPLNLAYLATRAGDNITAHEQFSLARAQGQLKGIQYVDAAYAARRVYENDEAIELLKRAIDEAGNDLEAQQLFNLRREVATLSRDWGAYLSFSHGLASTMPGGPLSAAKVGQLGSEIYWRPPGIGYRDGALFELFLRNFMTLYDEAHGPTGWPADQLSVGARWKPLRNYNLVLEVAQLIRLGEHSRNDTMLRMAYSDGAGTDLRVDVPSWWMWQGYAEVGRYIEVQQTFASFDLRGGRSYRLDQISDRLVVTPFIGVGGTFDSLLHNKEAIGAGPGLNLRWWFREDKYTAPMSYVDANVQYRFKLAGDDRAEGFFANLTVAY
ncbi:tetratricopeptide repeat protein [Brucella sp. BE17]|uniref:NfrA family protein n=1 Tax=Brucella sp. BE17 TaxID=3142977 RepID=UPI0031BA8FC4